jgi:hypothetical protein
MAGSSPSTAEARLNNFFFVARPHHDDLAAKGIRQRMCKIVCVSFVPRVG